MRELSLRGKYPTLKYLYPLLLAVVKIPRSEKPKLRIKMIEIC